MPTPRTKKNKKKLAPNVGDRIKSERDDHVGVVHSVKLDGKRWYAWITACPVTCPTCNRADRPYVWCLHEGDPWEVVDQES